MASEGQPDESVARRYAVLLFLSVESSGLTTLLLSFGIPMRRVAVTG
jgi:hypothetical protein